MNTKPATAVTDREGRQFSTKRQGVNAVLISWNWDRTCRVASWTTKGRAGVERMIPNLVHQDDLEVIEL